jgi:tRNA nucleotidyltransferase/poly(A) polymerase
MILSEISDSAIRRIDMQPFKRLFTHDLNRLIACVTHYGFKLRIVGGAVRDVLIGKAPRDIDFNTDALPDQIMYVLEKHKFRYTTRGIPHGTVKVIFSETEEYEITSLAYSVEDECCPEDIVIHSSQSWEGDAKRRDFTIDTLSVDMDGHLYDYVDGMEDLRNQFVRFIGDPAERINKDPVLILRFFKLLALFREPKFDKAVLPVLKQNMKLIKKLKPKRIALELSNVKRGVNADQVLRLMKNLGADAYTSAPPVIEHLLQYALDAQMQFLLEAAPDNMVPALKLLLTNGRTKIVPGRRGDIHAAIYDRLDPHMADNAVKIDSGFYDMQSKRYLTREEALQKIKGETTVWNGGALDSAALRDAQHQQMI